MGLSKSGGGGIIIKRRHKDKNETSKTAKQNEQPTHIPLDSVKRGGKQRAANETTNLIASQKFDCNRWHPHFSKMIVAPHIAHHGFSPACRCVHEVWTHTCVCGVLSFQAERRKKQRNGISS